MEKQFPYLSCAKLHNLNKSWGRPRPRLEAGRNQPVTEVLKYIVPDDNVLSNLVLGNIRR